MHPIRREIGLHENPTKADAPSAGPTATMTLASGVGKTYVVLCIMVFVFGLLSFCFGLLGYLLEHPIALLIAIACIGIGSKLSHR